MTDVQWGLVLTGGLFILLLVLVVLDLKCLAQGRVYEKMLDGQDDPDPHDRPYGDL